MRKQDTNCDGNQWRRCEISVDTSLMSIKRERCRLLIIKREDHKRPLALKTWIHCYQQQWVLPLTVSRDFTYIWGSLVKEWSKERFCFFCNTQEKKRGTFRCMAILLRCTVQETTKFMIMNILDDGWLDMVDVAQQKTCMHTSSPFLNNTDTVPISYTQVIYPNINHS